MSEEYSVVVPGSTSNLGSGFDTVSAALGLYLKVRVTPTEKQQLRWPADWSLSSEENAVERALKATCAEFGVAVPGLNFEVENEIPLKRGLGSSGAALVAGVKIAEVLAGEELKPDDAFRIIYPLEGHPDNLAASLYGGWVISHVEGDRMGAERLPARLRASFVVAIPETTVSTAAARSILPGRYSLEESVFNLQRCALLVLSLIDNRTELLARATEDRLHQAYRARLIPGAKSLLERKNLPTHLEDNLLSITVSGSGSTILAIAGDHTAEIGAWMEETFASNGVKASHRVLQLDEQGARVLSS